MVVPSLVKKILENDTLNVWGDGSNIRDFVHSKDVARGMMLVMKKSPGPNNPINLGSGSGYTIRKLLKIILSDKRVNYNPIIVWDTSKPSGALSIILVICT